MNSGKLQRFLFGLLIALLIAAAIGFLFFGDDFSVDILRSEIQSFGVWAPLVFILLYALLVIFFPSTPFMALAGILFGFKYGLIYTLVGGTLSSLVLFGISRTLGQSWVDSILRNKYLKPLKKYNARLERGGFADLVILRILPVMPFNVLNILMGVSRMSLSTYITGTIIGLIPSHIVVVYAGNVISFIF